VISSVRTQQSAGQTGHHFKVKVVDLNDRTFSPSANITVRASSDNLAIAGTGTPESFPVRLPIAAGQGIALFSADATDCMFNTANPGDQVLLNSSPEPGPGATVSATNGFMQRLLNLEATIEPDADGDGFGDETQDGCPTDPAIHTGPCITDLSAAQSVIPTTIGVGDVAVATVTLTNGSTGLAPGVTATAKVTPGLQVVSMIPGAGCSFSPDLSCSFGSLTGGASTVGAVVVRGVTAGAQSVSTVVGPTANDPNAANNTATTQITVEKRVALKCNVPSLKGLTKAVAKRLLAATNCKLGKATKKAAKTGKRGTVIKQSKKAGSKLAAGSKVNVTLKK
jgi:hypothetical protein